MSERTSENKARRLRRWSVILGVIALVLCLTGAVLLGIGRHTGDTATAPSATTGTPAASAGADAAAGAAARPSVSPSPLGEPTGAEVDMDTPVTASPGVGNADWDAEAGRPGEQREDTAPLPQHPGDDAPTNVRLPGVGLNVGVVSEDVRQVGDAWQMNLPVSSAAGWLSTSANLAPDATGSTVIAGHVNYTDASLAPMSRITQAQTGMEVLTTDTEGDTQRWRVTESKSVSQTELSDVFHLESGAGPRQLLLVTCELGPSGAFDHNRVVIAEPA